MAGTEVGSLYYDLNIDDSNLNKQLNDADKSVKGFGDKVNAYWGNSVDASRKFGLAIAGVTAGIVAFGVSSVKSFEQSQNVMAQTEAVIKSTGSAAGITAKQVTDLATALEKQTKFADEDVQKVENLLLTFTAIGKDIFPQATKTVLDMATALGEDTSSASIQLGKALQDPILGVTALRRVGVNFNQAQQDVIKNLVDTGKSAEAQKLILAELNKEFGGSAVAAGNTFAGSLAKLNNQLDNVKEAIGGMIATIAVPFLSAIMNWFYAIGGVDGVMQKLRETFEKVKPYIPEIAGAILGALVPALAAAAWSAGTFLATLAPWAAAGVAVVLVAKRLGISWDDVKNALAKLKPYWDDMVQGIKDAYNWYKQLSPMVQFLINPLAALLVNVNGFKQTVKELVQDLKDLWQWFSNLTVVIIIGQYITQVLWPALQAVAAAVWQNLLPALKQLWDALVRLWNALNPALMDALKIVGAILLGAFLIALWAVISVLNIIIQVFSMVVSAISIVIDWIANLIGWFGNLVGTAYNIIKTIAGILWNLPKAFMDVVATMWSIAGGIAGGILKAIGNLTGTLYNAGKDLIQGMINGITDKFKELAGAVKDAVGKAVSSVKNFLGIHSPSKVFHEIGNNVTQGFINGINDSSGLAVDAMNGFSNAIIAPSLNVSPTSIVGSGTNSTAPTSVRNTFTGEIHLGDAGAVTEFFDKLDRNTYLESIGVSPQATGGMA